MQAFNEVYCQEHGNEPAGTLQLAWPCCTDTKISKHKAALARLQQRTAVPSPASRAQHG